MHAIPVIRVVHSDTVNTHGGGELFFRRRLVVTSFMARTINDLQLSYRTLAWVGGRAALRPSVRSPLLPPSVVRP